MGFLKKITRPISRVLDKIVPNEIKPALPFLAAAAPFMAPGIMGAFGNTMLSRGLIAGGLNLGSQLAQEGSEGDFDALSLAMASGIGALSAPGSGANAANPVNEFGTKGVVSQQSAGDYLRGLSNTGGITDQTLNFLGTGADKLQGLQQGLAADGIFSKAGAKALSIPLTQGTMDLASAEGRRLEKQQIIDDALAALDDEADAASRASAIRLAMQQYGFTEDEITETISSAGYRAGGRVGLKGGGMDAGQMYITEPGIMGNPAVMEKIENMREFMIANPDIEDITDYSEKYEDKDDSEEVDFKGIEAALEGVDEDEKSEFLKKLIKFRDSVLDVPKNMSPLPDNRNMKDGGLMNLGGKEMDLRKGGFVPIGKKERADDVPARLSKNEFVMTADAVRAAGGGSVNKGAQRMYDIMNKLEARA